MEKKNRCAWAGADPRMIAYHDQEWGVPVHDDRLLFEFITLEGAQAGLSWQTILNKRDAYREAFAGFDPASVARFDRRRKRREGCAQRRLLRDRQGRQAWNHQGQHGGSV